MNYSKAGTYGGQVHVDFHAPPQVADDSKQNSKLVLICKLIGEFVNFVEVHIALSAFFYLAEKPMLNNTFQPAFNGGDIRKAHRLEPAFLTAYLPPNNHSLQKPVGGRGCKNYRGLSVLALFTTKNRH